MKTMTTQPTPRSALTLLLLSLCGPVAVCAEDPAVTALTQPQGIAELGAGAVSADSYKFGEYNGLQRQGGFLLGNLDLNGGGRYDSDSVTRWGLHANHVGLETGGADFKLREQGRFRLDLGYEQLRRNLSDSYQSPYLGLGTTDLTLPAGWLKPQVPQATGTNLNDRGLSPVAGQGSVVNAAGVVVPPTPAQLATLAAIVGTDDGAYHRFNLHTERKRGEVGFGLNLSRNLLLTGSVRRETREGSRMLGAVNSAIQENSVTLPEVIDTTTDQFNLGLEYTPSLGFLKAGYYGSIFKNDVAGIRWQDTADPTRTATMSSAPDNQFHQFNFTGGYSFSPATRLVADLSYGRARQNQAFLSDSSMPVGLPVSSADATVVTRLASVRLSARPTRKLGLFAHYKFDDRDNQTPVHSFTFYDVNLAKGATASAFNSALGLPAGTLSNNVDIFNNRPQSRKTSAFNVGGDYALGHRQTLSGGYDWEKIERFCSASWINCASAPESIDRTLHAEWGAQMFDSLGARLSFGHAQRRVHYDPNAWLALVPMANVIPGAPVVGATTSVYGYLSQNGLTGFGPLAGFPTVPLSGNAAIFSPNNNIVPQSLYGSRDNVSELPGMRRYNLADRNRDRLRSSLEWQASERLSLQGSFEFDRDDYLNSVFGLRRSSTWNTSVDASYTPHERLTVSAFYTHEDQKARTAGDGYGTNSNVAFIGRAGNTLVDGSCYTTVQSRNSNGKLDPCLIWTAATHDRADTVGASIARHGLWAHRLDLTGDLVFTRAQTDIDVNGASYANNPFALAGAPLLAAGVPATLLIPAANLPPIVTHTLELRLGAQFAVSKSTDVRLQYLYERTKAVDFAYQGLQFGTGTEQLPTLEQAPNYAVNVIALYFRHRFW
jgi:MtrB/PioB family decaheme-associated outer membrane protein